jgi:DNA repair and recombination protein RAD54B
LEELRNLFTLHETTCNTHDLLDCPCAGNGHVVEKDLLTLDDEDMPEEGFQKASQIKEEPKKHKFDALHEFWHFDPQRWKDRDDDDEFMCDVIQDDVLRGVVEKQLSSKRNGVGYLFGVKRG